MLISIFTIISSAGMGGGLIVECFHCEKYTNINSHVDFVSLQRTCKVTILMERLIDLSLYILFSHFRPCDDLMGIFLLFLSLVKRTFARA